jgi:hypothetical protein
MVDPDQALAQFKQSVLPKLHKVKHTSASIYYREAKLKLAEASARLLEEFSDQYPEVAMPLKKLSSYINEILNSVVNPAKEEEGDKKTFVATEWVADLRRRINPTFINPTEWKELDELRIEVEYSTFLQEESKDYKSIPSSTLGTIKKAAEKERQTHLEEERQKLSEVLSFDGNGSRLIEEIVDTFADYSDDPKIRAAYIGALKHFIWGVKSKLKGRDISKKGPLIVCLQSSMQAVGKNTLIDILFRPLGMFYKADTTVEEISDRFSVRTIAAHAVGHLDEFSDDSKADIAKVKSFATAFSKGGRGIFSEVYKSYSVRVSLIVSTNFDIFCHIKDPSGIRRFVPCLVKKSEEAFELFRRLATPEGQEEVLNMYKAIDIDAGAPAAPNTEVALEIARIQEEVVTNATLKPFLEKFNLCLPSLGDDVTVLPVNALYEVYSSYCRSTKRFNMDPLKFPTALATSRFEVSRSGTIEIKVTQPLRGALNEAGYRKTLFITKKFGVEE